MTSILTFVAAAEDAASRNALDLPLQVAGGEVQTISALRRVFFTLASTHRQAIGEFLSALKRQYGDWIADMTMARHLREGQCLTPRVIKAICADAHSLYETLLQHLASFRQGGVHQNSMTTALATWAEAKGIALSEKEAETLGVTVEGFLKQGRQKVETLEELYDLVAQGKLLPLMLRAEAEPHMSRASLSALAWEIGGGTAGNAIANDFDAVRAEITAKLADAIGKRREMTNTERVQTIAHIRCEVMQAYCDYWGTASPLALTCAPGPHCFHAWQKNARELETLVSRLTPQHLHDAIAPELPLTVAPDAETASWLRLEILVRAARHPDCKGRISDARRAERVAAATTEVMTEYAEARQAIDTADFSGEHASTGQAARPQLFEIRGGLHRLIDKTTWQALKARSDGE